MLIVSGGTHIGDRINFGRACPGSVVYAYVGKPLLPGVGIGREVQATDVKARTPGGVTIGLRDTCDRFTGKGREREARIQRQGGIRRLGPPLVPGAEGAVGIGRVVDPSQRGGECVGEGAVAVPGRQFDEVLVVRHEVGIGGKAVPNRPILADRDHARFTAMGLAHGCLARVPVVPTLCATLILTGVAKDNKVNAIGIVFVISNGVIEGECDTAPFTQVDDLKLAEGRVDRHHREGGIDRRQPVVACGIDGGAA